MMQPVPVDGLKADLVADRIHSTTFSYFYHRKVFGISVGTTLLVFVLVALSVFVVYAKHRSSVIYRATDDYEEAFERMTTMLVRETLSSEQQRSS